jgi:membrane-associated phospholipid phosphatase
LWVAVEVIATGNHFLLDILAGALVAATALIAASSFISRREATVG